MMLESYLFSIMMTGETYIWDRWIVFGHDDFLIVFCQRFRGFDFMFFPRVNQIVIDNFESQQTYIVLG